MLRYGRRFTRATSSRYATSRGQRPHATTSRLRTVSQVVAMKVSLVRRRKAAQEPGLTRKDRLIPGTEGFAFTLQIVTAGPFALPSLMQKLGAQFPNGSCIFNFNIAENAESFTKRARDAKFPRRQHRKAPSRARNYTASMRKSPGRTETILTAIVGASSTRG